MLGLPWSSQSPLAVAQVSGAQALRRSAAGSRRLCSRQQVGSNSLTRDATPAPDLGAWSLSQSITREVPPPGLKKQIKNLNVLSVAPIGEATYSSLQGGVKN